MPTSPNRPRRAREPRPTDLLPSIKKALTGSFGKRLEKLEAARSALPERIQNPDSRRAGGKAFLSAIRGLPGGAALYRAAHKEFSEVLARDEAKLKAAIEKSKAVTVANSKGTLKVLQAQAATHLENLQQLAELAESPGSPSYELLNKPFLIWPTNSVDLEASEIVPSNSWAKFRVSTDASSFYGNVKFYYLWQNPSDKFAVINIDGYVIFNGHAFVGVGGGVCPGDRSASVSVDGSLEILEWWNQPPTQPPGQPDQTVNALSLRVSAPGFSEVGALEAKDLFRGYDLRHTLMVVPPLSVLVFTVTAAVTCGNGEDSGHSEMDFASGALQVGSPAVLVTTLS